MSEDEKKKRVKARLKEALWNKLDGVKGVGLPHGRVTVTIRDADVEPLVRAVLATIDLEGVTVHFQVTNDIVACAGDGVIPVQQDPLQKAKSFVMTHGRKLMGAIAGQCSVGVLGPAEGETEPRISVRVLHLTPANQATIDAFEPVAAAEGYELVVSLLDTMIKPQKRQ